LNYEEQNQYKIQIQFSNQTNLFIQQILIDLEDINEPPHHLQCETKTGFCTAIEEDFNQTLTFQINPTTKQIICTDNGQPPLSVKSRKFSFFKTKFFCVIDFNMVKSST
jgi:hypothetical protein